MKFIPFFSLVLTIAFFLAHPVQGQNAAPVNGPSKIEVKGRAIDIQYCGETIFKGEIKNEQGKWRINSFVDDKDGLINQVFVITANDYSDTLEITGEICGSEESFPCEVDRKARGVNIVRHSSGLSVSLLNRAVYDRKRDWVLSVDFFSLVKIKPSISSSTSNSFEISIKGRELILRFRPRYYQHHRGFKFFEPWNYKIWEKPIVGWCSWYAFFKDVTEKKIEEITDVFAEKLLPFGYEYIQIDDGFQRGEGLPELWLETNEKFPGGLQHLVDYIKSKGMKPGIWTNVAFKQRDYADAHKEYFVLNEEGEPAVGNWITLSIDGSNPKALEDLVRPVYRGLKDMGWEYFKVDALRHLRYEGYNAFGNYFKTRGKDRVDAFRALVQSIREEIGRDVFMMGCWGIRPELMGIIDACRIGNDGFAFAGLSQYNSFNNVIWLNDPDHIVLSEVEAFRSTMVTSLTGSLFLVTDKAEKYSTPLIEPAKRAAPVLFTRPGQLYEVDPSRVEQLHRVDSEVSGSGERIFDAGYTPKCQLYLLEINRPFENWVALGRTGGSIDRIHFADLGLDSKQDYLIFEFWSKMFDGNCAGSFHPGRINPAFNCQLFIIREKKDHPQVVATSRHISGGGLELKDMKWEKNVLSGKSMLVGGDPYFIYITKPNGYKLEDLTCEGVEVRRVEKHGLLKALRLESKTGKEVDWAFTFSKLDPQR